MNRVTDVRPGGRASSLPSLSRDGDKGTYCRSYKPERPVAHLATSRRRLWTCPTPVGRSYFGQGVAATDVSSRSVVGGNRGDLVLRHAPILKTPS